MSILSSYINHVKRQNEQVKLFHGALWAGVFTGLFATVYLYVIYDITPPVPGNLRFDNSQVYSRDQNNTSVNQRQLENNKNSDSDKDNSSSSPIDSIINLFRDSFSKASNIKNDIKNTNFDNTATFSKTEYTSTTTK